MEDKCILGVFAHPDDETFSMAGAYRRYRDQGVRTALVCATRGDAGEISDPALATPETLGQVRDQELREACRIMGVEDLTFLGYGDGRLKDADPVEATGRIVRQMRRVRPQVVVTFGANGGYGHVDHIAIHVLTVAAFQQAGDPNCFPEQLGEGLKAHAPQKLYAVGFARSTMSALREAPGGAAFRPGGDAATIPLEEMGTADDEITTALELTDAEFETKMRAMQAHRTQLDPNGPMNRLPPDRARAWLGTERFVQLLPPGAPGNSAERDLFAGVRV